MHGTHTSTCAAPLPPLQAFHGTALLTFPINLFPRGDLLGTKHFGSCGSRSGAGEGSPPSPAALGVGYVGYGICGMWEGSAGRCRYGHAAAEREAADVPGIPRPDENRMRLSGGGRLPRA